MIDLAVVIPSKNAANLVPCIQAIRRHEPAVRIQVVDDGLDLDAIAKTGSCFCCENDPVHIVPGVKPFIFARNMNIGIRAAGSDDVVLLNDDALIETPGGFTALQQQASEHPEYGIISAVTNCAGNPRQFPRNQGLRLEKDTVAFVCVYIPRRTLDAVGMLDERFVTYGWEDNDYCRRVRDAGLEVGIFDGCFVDHHRLRSTFRGAPGQAGDIEPGRRIFNAKWGIR